MVARVSGLTASALRFYDDCGLLVPARVDAGTGYPYYAGSQSERAVMIRQLRRIGVGLDAIAVILSGDAEPAKRLLDAHILDLENRAREPKTVVRSVKHTLSAGTGASHVTLPAVMLADAIGQVRPAAAQGDEFPVLTGL
jgi:DNA-binding transcriptional MerR regulator